MCNAGWIVTALAAFALAAGPSSAAGAEARPEVLATLRAGHPRLFVTRESLERLRAGVGQDAGMKTLYEKLRKEADKTLREEPVRYELVGPRLLSVSRKCLDRVSTLALVHLVSGEAKYAERAWKELEAAAKFPDWHPQHFLDTAEMTCAFGIGYDWLYSFLSDAQRAQVRQAIVEKGLQEGLNCYRGKASYGWWTRAHHNWSQVCNGGLAVGALAVADEEPAVAAEVLTSGLKAVQGAMANFGVDGGWNEGPGYWDYTLRYTSTYLTALQSALGSMKGLDQTPGLAETGLFRIHFIGPTGRTFNFADAHEGAGSAAAMFWLARVFDRPVYAAHERRTGGGGAFDLLWYTPEGQGPAESGLAPSKLFRGVNVAFLRSAWDNPNALWVGFKGGDNQANHSHLDLGTFVLDALGERWALDLGGDDYNLPGYFGDKRWTYYRLRTEGHNTLVVNGENQAPKAKAPVVAFSSTRQRVSAVADLSQGYPMCGRVLRGMAMIAPGEILIQDEVSAGEPVGVVWQMHTQAEVKPEKNRAVLSLKGKRLGAEILEPAGAVFEVAGANPPPPEAQQPDVRKLVVRLPEKVKEVRFVVRLMVEGVGAESPEVRPLAEWPGRIENAGGGAGSK